MSTSTLLNTSTVSYLELVGNGRSYRVPPYQRDYSWTEEQWEDLWLDLTELRPDAKRRHYMGAVVVKPESDRRFLIIDGQQRLATLATIGLSVIHRLVELSSAGSNDENGQRANGLRARFIGEKDPASLIEVSKLNLNEHDDAFFQDHLVNLREPLNPRSLTKSNRLLWDAFQYFRRKISSDDQMRSDGAKLAEFLSEVVARRLMFILITVEDEINAYTVFETLNARGLELTTTDLLKNYLFSRINVQTDLAVAQRRWHRLVTTVRQERFGEFLRYHYLTLHSKIRTGRLFKIVRDEVSSPEDVFSLIDKLEGRAVLFEALGDEHNPFWVDFDGAAKYVRELKVFRVRQMTPLLFAAYERLSAADFVRVLKLISTISFRYSVVGGLNTNELEPVYHGAAKAVLDGTAETPRAVFQELRAIYVSDEKFAADFAQLSMQTTGARRRTVKYILSKLEESIVGHAIDPEADPGTIEHVLPENPSSEWEDFIPKERWEEATYRMGNLTLLEAGLNRGLGNALYPAKLSAYTDSHYALTNKIPDDYPEEWNLRRIEDRQQALAKRATSVWRADFA